MYDSLASFLRNFSVDFPLLWALLVMAVVAGTGLSLYVFWELVLRWASSIFSPRNHNSESNQV
jgi:predicted permease